MLHPFKANVDREVTTTRVALENLNVTVLVMPQTILDYSSGLAIDTGVDCDWLNDHILPHMSTEFQTELDSPNVLTLDFSVDVVGA